MKILENEKRYGIKRYCTGSGNGGKGCGAALFIELEDIYETYSHDYLGEKTTYKTFRCPLCGKQTDIDEILVEKLVNQMERENDDMSLIMKL